MTLWIVSKGLHHGVGRAGAGYKEQGGTNNGKSGKDFSTSPVLLRPKAGLEDRLREPSVMLVAFCKTLSSTSVPIKVGLPIDACRSFWFNRFHMPARHVRWEKVRVRWIVSKIQPLIVKGHGDEEDLCVDFISVLK